MPVQLCSDEKNQGMSFIFCLDVDYLSNLDEILPKGLIPLFLQLWTSTGDRGSE